MKTTWLNLLTTYRLNRLGVKQIKNFHCPDGFEHYFNIDRLILRPEGITLLQYKRFPGSIFCAEKIDDWTQMYEKQSFRFNNPLYDLDIQIKAVSACVPDVPVNGYLYFDFMTEFPKGHPDQVVHFKTFPDELKLNKKDSVIPKVSAAWDKLLKMNKN